MRTPPRGTVSFLFTDVEGSTRLLQALGRERYGEVLREHRRLLREVWDRHDGYEVDTEGDAFLVAFAHASNAVAAAVDAQRALAAAEWPDGHELRVRIGIHTGEATERDGDYVGIAVHRAARIAAAANGGQVLVSETTRALSADERVAAASLHSLGLHRLKDFDEPAAIYQLGEGSFPPLKTVSNTNLPRPASSFVGREREIGEVVSLVREGVRLVTLSGPGGSGKTRLAIEAAADVVGEMTAGVFWVALATVRDPALVTETIGQVLGARDDLAVHIGSRQLLLVLDNLEQVIDAAAKLVALLTACPNLQLLVTSRELLRVQAETDYPVPPLDTPEAVKLFGQRAQLDPDSTIAELCVRLDNLPLAVELAAARTRVLTPAKILERLTQRLDLLKSGRDADPRQQTLRATIAWSHDLLAEGERRLFARLAVFAGGCTLEAAEDVIDADIDTLQSLVDKSLVRHSIGRFWMLETIREYAAERLEESGEAPMMQHRHAEFFLALAEEVELSSRTGDQPALFERLSADNANLRQAVKWAREHGDIERELRLVTALWSYWLARGHVREGRRWLEDALARTDEPPARALLGLCMLRHLEGDEVRDILEKARRVLRTCEADGDEFALAQAWNLIGRLEGSGLLHVAVGEEAWRRALEYAERGNYAAEKAESMGWLMVMSVAGPLPTDEGIARCKDFFEKAGDDEKVRAFSQVERAVLEAMQGNFEMARALLDEGHRRFEALGLRVWAANNAQEAFYVEMLANNPVAAAETLLASYDDLEKMGERGFLSTIAGMLAHALQAQGADDEADRYSRESERLAASDDLFSQMFWRTARAKVLARRGKTDRAVDLAQEAVRMGMPTDCLIPLADATLDLAVVLRAAGREAEARAAATEAARLYEQKKNLVALDNARLLLTDLGDA